MEALRDTIFEVSNAGIRICGQIHGSGHPIVFLHGFPEFCGVWSRQVTYFAQHNLTIAPDLRGCNLSDKPQGARHFSIDALASDVVAVLDQLTCAPATLVGHDIGGMAAWWVAANMPERVNGLIQLSSPHPADYLAFRANHPELHNYWNDMLDGKISELTAERLTFWAREEERAELLAALRRSDFAAICSIYRMCLGRDCLQQWLELPKIDVPSLLIYGEADEFIPPEAYANTQERFARPARIAKFPEGGHFLHSRMGDQLNFTIDKWLDELRQDR